MVVRFRLLAMNTILLENTFRRTALTEWQLPIEGMSCASCVARVERSLADVPGVQDVSVNFATEQASVKARGDVDMETLKSRRHESRLPGGRAILQLR
jgi:Cu+-exporting ATPase